VCRVVLQEGVLRLLATAAPGRTQQLFDSPGWRAPARPGLVCRGAGRYGGGAYMGEWEHALALILACRHLPLQLLASPGEKAGQQLALSTYVQVYL
jgi:sterol regulatory element-binding transcription factor 1